MFGKLCRAQLSHFIFCFITGGRGEEIERKDGEKIHLIYRGKEKEGRRERRDLQERYRRKDPEGKSQRAPDPGKETDGERNNVGGERQEGERGEGRGAGKSRVGRVDDTYKSCLRMSLIL
jgi:hypothetical protein